MYYVIENGEVKRTDRERMRTNCPGFGYLSLQELEDCREELGLPASTVRECAGRSLHRRLAVLKKMRRWRKLFMR